MDVVTGGRERSAEPKRGRRVTFGALGLVLATVTGLGIEVGLVLQRDFLGAGDAPELGGDFEGPNRETLRIAVLGDSTAAGVGVRDARESVAERLALLLAHEWPVHLDVHAESGARAADLADQVTTALGAGGRPHLAVILVGPNDATHPTSLASVRSDVRTAVERLVEDGVTVVVGSCADMGAATAFPQPLRAMVGWRGRRVGTAVREAARAAGAAVVDIGAETGPAFRRDPDTHLAEDEFHPSAEGYSLWAEALEDAVLDAAARAMTTTR